MQFFIKAMYVWGSPKLIPINIIIYVGEDENLNDKLFTVSKAAFYASTYLQPRLLMEGALICLFFCISGVEILHFFHHSLWTENQFTNNHTYILFRRVEFVFHGCLDKAGNSAKGRWSPNSWKMSAAKEGEAAKRNLKRWKYQNALML